MYNCTWIITAPSNHTVKLTFTIFNLFDYLTIYRSEIEVFDGKSKNDTLLGIFSGSRRPFIVQTSGQFMMVTFKRYHKFGYFNFKAVYVSTSIKGELYVPRKLQWNLYYANTVEECYSVRLVERLRFSSTPNGRREFVPRDQVFRLFFVHSLLLLHKSKKFYASFNHMNRSGLFLPAYFLF